jgi:hypothetical protein
MTNALIDGKSIEANEEEDKDDDSDGEEGSCYV